MGRRFVFVALVTVAAFAVGCSEGSMRSSKVLLAERAWKGLPPDAAASIAAAVSAAARAPKPTFSALALAAAQANLPSPPAHVTPFPVMDFESYKDTAALANDWNAFGRGDGYTGAVRLACQGNAGKALALDFTLGVSGSGQSGVSLSTPWASVPNTWDLTSKPALALEARCTGGPVVVTFVVFCLDARSPSGETPFFTRFEVSETTETCYVSLAHLSRSSLQSPGSFFPDLTRVTNIQFLPDGILCGPATLLIDSIRPSALPATFARLLPPPAAKDTQFVVLTFDDCGAAEGLDWIHDELACLDLRGNATLFLTTAYGDPTCPLGDDWQRIRKAWRRFGREGYELGNHSHTHNQDAQTGAPVDGTLMSVGAWRNELKTAHDQIVEWTGVKPRIARAPRLEASHAYYKALTSLGYESDSSLQLGGFKFRPRSWPHTLAFGLAPDEWARLGPLPPFSLVNGEWVAATGPQYQQHAGTIGRHGIRSLGMTEWDRTTSDVPVASFLENLTFRTYTPDAPTDVKSCVQAITDDFDRHYYGNRSPFHIAAHSQTLVYNASTAALGETIDWKGRRQVLDCVLRYMRGKKHVKFVRASDLLDLTDGRCHDEGDDQNDHRDRREER